MMAAIANGGKQVQPHIARRVSGRPVLYENPRSLGLKPTTLAAIRRGLFMAVNAGGSAQLAQIADLTVAGKTGSAQVVSSSKLRKDVDSIQPRAWFAGFAPISNPRIALAVLVDHGGSGGTAAAPVALAIFEKFFGRSAALSTSKQISP
jgi:penicillin-binding protein 2